MERNRIFAIILFSTIMLIACIAKTEGRLPWRNDRGWLAMYKFRIWTKEEKKAYRKKEYRFALMLWIFLTIGFTVAVIFLWD